MNVLLVVVDTLRQDAVDPYGADGVTPNLDRIAEESIVYDDATAASCWTMPTHASMFTGVYPSRHRAIEPRVQLDESVTMVSELLSDSGYRTHAVNIPHPLAWSAGFDRGWDEFENTYRDPKHVQLGRLLKYWYEIGLKEHPLSALSYTYLDRLRSNYRTRYAVDRLADVAASEGDSFAFTNLFAAHREYEPLPPDAPDVSEDAWKLSTREDNYQIRHTYGDLDLPDSVVAESKELYEAEVSFVDAAIGHLFDRLEAEGALSDTVVIITGDHGELFGESEEVPIAHRNVLHPVLLDVPLIVYHPDRDGDRDDRLASHVDVAPTVLDAAGVADDYEAAIEAMDGYSLFGDREHDVVFAEHGPNEDVSRPELEEQYEFDFSPFYLARKVARTKDYTVRFRSDGSVRAHDRRDPDGEVPEDEIERLRKLVDDRFQWASEATTDVTDEVRDHLADIGYLG